MHILFLTDNFPPEVNAPASRTHEHCRQWVAAGAQVTVITCAPNFPKGRVFDGYSNRPWQEEVVDGSWREMLKGGPFLLIPWTAKLNKIISGVLPVGIRDFVLDKVGVYHSMDEFTGHTDDLK